MRRPTKHSNVRTVAALRTVEQRKRRGAIAMANSPNSQSAVEYECDDDDHDWRYDGGDWSVGIPGAWVCQKCGKEDCQSEPPSYDDDY